MVVAKMKRGPCCGILVLVLLCFVYATMGIWSHKDVEEVAVETSPPPEKLPFSNFPRPTETLRENLPFSYFDSSLSYQTEGRSERPLTTHELAFIEPAKALAEEHLKENNQDAKFVNGRYRWLPEGVEFDFYFRDSLSGIHSRVTLFQKLESPQTISSFPVNHNTKVNIVVPLKGHVSKYTTFLDHLVKNVITHDENLSLSIIYFTDSYLSEIRNLTAKKLEGLPNFKWSLIPVDEAEFSRGRGLHIGTQVPSSKDMGELLFFCDVDVLMHRNFFQRCRSNTKKGYQVYYPVVFSLYNPKLVYPLFEKEIPSIEKQLVIDEQSGFWRTFGFGMACMYQSDYQASGGFPDIRSWGGEDVALYEKFLKLKNIKVIRAPDPSLFHLYHHKLCSDMNSVSYPACLKSKAVTEGSQLQLGLVLMKLHEGIDLEGVLTKRSKQRLVKPTSQQLCGENNTDKRFYYFWLIPYLGSLLMLSLVINLVQTIIILKKRGHNYRTM